MVLGRRELSMFFLGGAAIVLYLVLLTTPSEAQLTEARVTETDTINQTDRGCPNPRLVETFTGSDDDVTSTFRITGNAFRLSSEVDTFGQGPGQDATVRIDVVDQNGNVIETITIEDTGDDIVDDVTIIPEGPGTFGLEIAANNANYSITVDDCIGTGRDRTTRRPPEVIEEIINVPRKPLPPSGGLPVYGMVAGFILTGTGLLALGIGIRRRLRR